MSATSPVSPARRLEQLMLVLTMFSGSIAMWLGSPVFWLWLAGRSSKVSTTAMTSLVMVGVGIPATMLVIGKLLAKLDGRYTAQFGINEAGAHNPARWMASMRGGSTHEEPTMLDKIMVLSIGLAFLAVGVYFVFFSAGSQMRG